MKRGLVIVLMLLISCSLFGQRYFTRTGEIKFFSKAPMENIEAHNYNVLSVLDLSRGQVAVDMLIKNFEFEKKLMQEHFNENYMESGKIPKSTYKGAFVVPEGLMNATDGTYKIDVNGEISIHGVTKPLNQQIDLVVENGKISTEFVFNVKVKDHDIKIPNMVVKNIAEEIEVTANFTYEPYER